MGRSHSRNDACVCVSALATYELPAAPAVPPEGAPPGRRRRCPPSCRPRLPVRGDAHASGTTVVDDLPAPTSRMNPEPHGERIARDTMTPVPFVPADHHIPDAADTELEAAQRALASEHDRLTDALFRAESALGM